MPSTASVKSIKDFFQNELVYRFDVLEDWERKELNGNYAFALKGEEDKEDCWTISIDKDMEVVHEKVEGSETVMTMRESDFLNMVNAKINPQLAILSKKLSYTGSLDRVLKVQCLLFPGE